MKGLNKELVNDFEEIFLKKINEWIDMKYEEPSPDVHYYILVMTQFGEPSIFISEIIDGEKVFYSSEYGLLTDMKYKYWRSLKLPKL